MSTDPQPSSKVTDSPDQAAAGALSMQTASLMVFSVAGLAIGFLNNLIIAYLYGAGLERDAYLIAMVVPAYVISIFAGTLVLQFIPIFIQLLRVNVADGWRFLSAVFNLVVVGGTAVVAAVVIFARPICRLLAPSFSDSSLDLAADLLRILAPSIVLTTLSGYLSNALVAQRRSLVAGLVPLVGAVVVSAVNVLLFSFIGIHSVAVSFTAGAAVSCAILIWQVLKVGRYSFVFALGSTSVGSLIRSSWPLLLSSVVYRYGSGFERMIAATLPPGSISLLGYATQLMSMFSAITSNGIAVTVFPPLAEAWAKRDLTSISHYFRVGVRTVLFLSLPIATFCFFFSETLVAGILQRGAFDAQSTAAVSACVRWLLVGFVAANLGTVAVRLFYVSQRTTFLGVYAVAETIIYLALGVFLAGRFSIGGLALASSLRDTLGFVVCTLVAHRLIAPLHLGGLFSGVWRIAAACVGAALVAGGVQHVLAPIVSPLVTLLALSTCGGAVYVALTVGPLHVPEARRLLQLVLKRVRPATSLATDGR